MRTGWLLMYWIIGCLLAGAGEAIQLKRCPDMEFKIDLAKIAAWPFAVGVVMVLGTEWRDDHPPRACESAK